MTSHDVVDRARRIFGTRRVGHSGTLDPQATGLLVLLVGESTKISEYLISHDKTYEGTMQVGFVSDTYDSEGEVVPGPGGAPPKDLAAAQETANEFIGEFDQVPPPYSARKVQGKKLYEYAREGEAVEAPSKRTRVDDFELLTYNDGKIEFGIDCGSGTYVRSMVHDWGQKFGCGAILIELRRTDLGGFGIEDAHTLEHLQSLETDAEKRATLMPIRKALPKFPAVFLGAGAERWIRHGQPVPANMVEVEDDQRLARGTLTVLCRLNGEAVSIARVDPVPVSPPPRSLMGGTGPWFQPIKQFDVPLETDEEDQ